MQGDCAMVLVAAVANVNIFLSVSAAGGATGTTSISETLAVGAAFGPPQICLRPGHVGMQDEPPCGLAWLGQWSWQTLGVSKRKPLCPADRRGETGSCASRRRRLRSVKSCNAACGFHAKATRERPVMRRRTPRYNKGSYAPLLWRTPLPAHPRLIARWRAQGRSGCSVRGEVGGGGRGSHDVCAFEREG